MAPRTGPLGENYENDEGGFPETKEGDEFHRWERTGSERSEERLKEQVRNTLRQAKEQEKLLKAPVKALVIRADTCCCYHSSLILCDIPLQKHGTMGKH